MFFPTRNMKIPQGVPRVKDPISMVMPHLLAAILMMAPIPSDDGVVLVLSGDNAAIDYNVAGKEVTKRRGAFEVGTGRA